MNPLKALIARVALALLLPATSAAAADEVIVASKIDTEGALLGNVIAVLLENKGIAIRNKIQLGPTKIVRAAILAGQVDIYPEYTGIGALFSTAKRTRHGRMRASVTRRSERSIWKRTIWSGLRRLPPTTSG